MKSWHILKGIGYLAFVQIEPVILQSNPLTTPKVHESRHTQSFYFSSGSFKLAVAISGPLSDFFLLLIRP